ncbi:MAG TPA: DUF3180 domain-containing protein [Marmoricola sp.]
MSTPEPEDGPPKGRLEPSGPGPIAIFAGIGLILGWSIRAIALHQDTTEPTVSWVSVAIVFFLAAIVGWTAFHTARSRREGIRLAPHRAVNRLVLGKTCALAGALIAGGYFGFALAHVNAAGADAASSQLWHSVAAGIGGVCLVVAALLLEQACRVPPEDR